MKSKSKCRKQDRLSESTQVKQGFKTSGGGWFRSNFLDKVLLQMFSGGWRKFPHMEERKWVTVCFAEN